MASDSYAGAWSFSSYDAVWLPFAVLGGTSLLILVALCIILKRRDPV
jgi:hypothetical protein